LALYLGNIANRFTDQGFKAKIVMLCHEGIPLRTLGYVDWTYYEMVDGRIFMNFGWKGDLRHAALYNIKK
jgi:hypothetical protein